MSSATPRSFKRVTPFTAQAATGASAASNVHDFKNMAIMVSGAGTASMTLQVVGSIADTAPTLSSAASATNPYSLIQIKEMIDDGNFNGQVTIAADGVRMFRVNVDQLEWIGVKVSAYTSGNITVTLLALDNA
jgi:hypothetical protein